MVPFIVATDSSISDFYSQLNVRMACVFFKTKISTGSRILIRMKCLTEFVRDCRVSRLRFISRCVSGDRLTRAMDGFSSPRHAFIEFQ